MAKGDSYHSGFHYSPWGEGISSCIWHNWSDRLSAAFSFHEGKKKEKEKQQHCASSGRGADI